MKFDREELAEILSRSRHPMRWEYNSTSNIQDEDYAQADAVIAHYANTHPDMKTGITHD